MKNEKNLYVFSYSKNSMALEEFRLVISSSIHLLFLKSA